MLTVVSNNRLCTDQLNFSVGIHWVSVSLTNIPKPAVKHDGVICFSIRIWGFIPSQSDIPFDVFGIQLAERISLLRIMIISPKKHFVPRCRDRVQNPEEKIPIYIFLKGKRLKNNWVPFKFRDQNILKMILIGEYWLSEKRLPENVFPLIWILTLGSS